MIYFSCREKPKVPENDGRFKLGHSSHGGGRDCFERMDGARFTNSA